MRRFERTDDGLPRTWSVDLRGSELHVTSGPPGREKTRIRTLRNPDVAARALEEAIVSMVEAGWVETVIEAEVAEDTGLEWIASHDDDPAPYLVLGDQLHDKDPVRSAVIAVQGAKLRATPDRIEALEQEEARLLEEHGPELLGPLVDSDAEVTWFWGFLSGLVLVEPKSGTLAETLEELVTAGQIPLLRSLSLQTVRLEPLGYVFARHRWPALRTLALKGRLTTPATALITHMPRLGHLRLDGPTRGFGFAHLTLHTLELVGLHRDFEGFSSAELPALRRLSLGCVYPIDPKDLRRWTQRPLQALQLAGGLPQQYLEELRTRSRLPKALVLRAPTNATLLAALLLEKASRLKRVKIRLEEVDLLDAEIEELEAVLDIEVALPESTVSRSAQLSPDQTELKRLEKERGGKCRFWSIVREGEVVVMRWGQVGQNGQTQRKAFPTEEGAAVDYRRRLRRKLAEGWRVA